MATDHPIIHFPPSNPRTQDISGWPFRQLIVLGYAGNFPVGKGKLKAYWWCQCGCGKIIKARANSLFTGNTTTCGCGRTRHLIRHGLTRRKKKVPEHNVWCLMRKRCRDPQALSFENYGGRGITVCRQWCESFGAFYLDMGPRPGPEYTIDRIDNDRGYSCGRCDDCRARGEAANCRWITRKEQGRNKRNNHRITFRGQTHCLSEWAEILGIPCVNLRGRLSCHHWPVERAFTTPYRGQPLTEVLPD